MTGKVVVISNPRTPGKSHWQEALWERSRPAVSPLLAGWGCFRYVNPISINTFVRDLWIPCLNDTVVRSSTNAIAVAAIKINRRRYIAAIVRPNGDRVTAKGGFTRKEEAQAYADLVYWHRIT